MKLSVIANGHQVLKLFSKKLLCIMKLTTLLILLASLHVFATSNAQDITLSTKGKSLSQILLSIKQQSGFQFVYSEKLMDDKQQINLDFKQVPLRDVLDKCLSLYDLKYTIEYHTIILLPADKKKTRSRSYQTKVVSPLREISGIVTDSSGKAIAGVSVTLIGTGQGTTTDGRGRFTLQAKDGDVLQFSYVGYESTSITVGSQTTPLNIRLMASRKALEDIVMIGYGSQKREFVTGAISTVKSDAFENRPLNNTMDALQGALPGVTITRASGQPGAQGYSLQIRGYSSINGNSPLVLIDGIPGDMNSLNPTDIAEVTVLKDAAAAIYGARAADGVILVTTKKGMKGPPVVSYSGNFGIKQPTYLRKIMPTLHFAEFLDEGLRNVGLSGFPQEVFDKIESHAPMELDGGWNYGISSYPGFFGNVNWNDAIYKNSFQQLHNLSISGGSDHSTYLFSVGYNQDNGILNFGENNSNRYNLRLNYDFKIGSKLNVSTKTVFENQVVKTPTMIDNALSNVPRIFPYQPVYNENGNFYGYQGYENPAQSLEEGGLKTANSSLFNANLKADYHIINGLTLTGQASIRMNYLNENANTRTFTRYNYVGEVQDIRNTPNSAYYTNNKSVNKLYQAFFNYEKQISNDHHLNITAGASLEQNKNEGQTTYGYNFLNNDLFTLNLADRTKTAYTNFTGLLNNAALGSYFGRLSYSFRNKLTLDLTARADGSSKFSPDKRWSAVFPSAAIAYNLSKEPFIRSLGAFDLFKLRASWGKMGNQDIGELGLYDYIPLINVDGNYPIGSPNAGLPGASANPASVDRTWETIENKNIGLDLAAFNSRLSFSFDYFNKTNNDMLVAIGVPATFGGDPPSSNQGKLVTKGFETSLGWKDKVGDFTYSVSLQLSDNTNKLVELKNSDSYGEGLNFVREGYPIYSYFGYAYDGIIKTEKQLNDYKSRMKAIPTGIQIGDVMYKDLDGDGKLTAFGDKTKGLSGDMKYLGNLNPRFTYASNIQVGYKHFSLQLILQGVGKRTIQYEGAISTPNSFFWPSLDYYYDKTWSPERPDAKYPRYIPGSVGFDELRGYDYHTSSLLMQNMSYLRFKVITIGYNLPTAVAAKMKMKTARVYISGQDLFTVSKGTLGGNFDPEDGYRNEQTYPFVKVYSLGIQLKF